MDGVRDIRAISSGQALGVSLYRCRLFENSAADGRFCHQRPGSSVGRAAD